MSMIASPNLFSSWPGLFCDGYARNYSPFMPAGIRIVSPLRLFLKESKVTRANRTCAARRAGSWVAIEP
jgi:hypothetical protein